MAAERTTYIVHKANIKDDDNQKKKHGETVALGPVLARRYNRLGYLRPYLGSDDDDEEDVTDEAVEVETTEAPERYRRRRTNSIESKNSL